MEYTCKNCRHFNNDPRWLEQSFKGMQVFSSGFASVKSDDGLCNRKDILLSPVKANTCRDFELISSSSTFTS